MFSICKCLVILAENVNDFNYSGNIIEGVKLLVYVEWQMKQKQNNRKGRGKSCSETTRTSSE